MKKVIVAITALFVLQIIVSCVNADVNDLPMTEYIIVDGQKIKLENGLDLSRKDLRGIVIHRQGGSLENIDFNNSNLDGADFHETSFDNCSFRGSRLINLPYFCVGSDCDLTDAVMENITYLAIPRKQLESTASFKSKSLRGLDFNCSDLRGVNFSGFNLYKVGFAGILLDDCDFTDAIIKECGLGGGVGGAFTYEQLRSSSSYYFGMTYEQIRSTKSYKTGALINVKLQLTWPEGHADFSKMNLTGCVFGPGGTYNHVKIDDLGQFRAKSQSGHKDMPEKRGWCEQCQLNITDSVITDCDFWYFKGLTLENVKSTWNYKNGRMEGIRFSEEIQKLLDAEKEAQ